MVLYGLLMVCIIFHDLVGPFYGPLWAFHGLSRPFLSVIDANSFGLVMVVAMIDSLRLKCFIDFDRKRAMISSLNCKL